MNKNADFPRESLLATQEKMYLKFVEENITNPKYESQDELFEAASEFSKKALESLLV